ncbi:MAG: ribosomal RNA small subunit methyltransferase A [Clostridia bacterium]|nr:ribosomal RNA small subunit methyltransferase A [Clostridia bacterium]
MNLCDVKTIKDVMSIFGLTFRKEFGQNFLTDKSVVEAIADSCAAANTKTVLEIGAGCGSLTHELALRYEKVIAIEIDRGLIPLLGYTLGEHKNVEVICGDVMKTDIRALLGDAFERGGVSVCANLPYYITTPILLELLGSGLPFDCITVMIQSEVADRLCAAAGHRDYGSVTAYLNYFGTCQKLLKVPAGKFLPPPKVDSTVVRIDLYKDKLYKPLDEALFFRTLRAAFEQRRKTLPNALSAGISELSKDELTDAILACGFAANIRGEVLSTADFVKLSDEIYKRIK